MRDLIPTSAAVDVPASDGSGPMPWQRALDSWQISLDSPRTRANYVASVRLLFGEPIPVRSNVNRKKKPAPREYQTRPGMPDMLDDLTSELLGTWRGSLVRRTEKDYHGADRLATATVNRHLSAVRAFLIYWLNKALDQRQESQESHVRLGRDEVLRLLKLVKGTTQRPYAVLSPGEVDAIMAASVVMLKEPEKEIPADRRTRQTPLRRYRGRDQQLIERDAVIVQTALGTGLRCDELRALAVGDLFQREIRIGAESRQTWWLTVRQGKGNTTRQVPLSEEVAAEIRAYLTQTGRRLTRTIDREMPLFLNRRGFALSASQVRRIIDGIADQATAQGRLAVGKQISPHALRHTYATGLLRGDPATGRRPASIAEVQKLLGHRDIRTTERYVRHIEEDQLAELAPVIRRRAE